jgi:hypothetical protein
MNDIPLAKDYEKINIQVRRIEKWFEEIQNGEYFWQFNKHYAHFKDWVYNKFNLDLAKETILDIQMNKRTTN